MRKTRNIFIGIVLLVLSLSLGSVVISPLVVLKILINSLFGRNIFKENWNPNLQIIVINIRLFRVLFAFLVGASLSLAGDITQKVTKNPLMDPYILGVSSTVVFANILLLILNVENFIIRIIFSLFMSMITLTIILLISRKIGQRKNIVMILIGFSISTAISSINSILLYVKTEGTEFKSFVFWAMGSLEIYNLELLIAILMILFVSLASIIILNKEYELISMGQKFSTNTGLDYHRYSNCFLIISVILTAVVVSVCGTIGFIGIIVPNIVKILNIKNELVTMLVWGGGLLVISDLVSRMILPPLELPVGIITSLLGGVFFIYYMVVKNHD